MINIKQFLLGQSIWILVGSIIVAIGVYRTSQQTKKFEAEIKAKNEEVSRLNEYILSSITGGDSFCYLALSSINHTANIGIIGILSKGKYPLYEVNCRFVDVEEFNKILDNPNSVDEKNLTLKLSFEDLMRGSKVMDVGNIPPNTYRPLFKINFGSGDEKKYNVFISARNGSFTQLIRLKRVDGEWKTAMKIEKNEGEKKIEIIEEIAEGFPRNEKGEINWK